MGRYSRYNKTRQTTVPKPRKSRKVIGSGDDDGKWYKCRFCGFINNVDRNVIGDGEGLSYSIAVLDNSLINADGATEQFISTGGAFGEGVFGEGMFGEGGESVSMGIGNIGITGSMVLIRKSPVPADRHNVVSEAVSGCSFCGSRNWR